MQALAENSADCGFQMRTLERERVFIVADQTYVLENENDDVFLPDLVAQAKTEGI